MLKYLKSLFAKKPQPAVVSTTDNTPIAMNDIERTRQEILRRLRDDAPMSHHELQIAVKLLFGVDLPTSMWRLRRTQESLLFFRICGIVYSDSPKMALRLRMQDDSLGTTLALTIDITELHELMEPVPPIDLSRLQPRSKRGA